MIFVVAYTYGLIVKIFNNPHQQVFELFSKMLTIFIPSAVWTFLVCFISVGPERTYKQTTDWT